MLGINSCKLFNSPRSRNMKMKIINIILVGLLIGVPDFGFSQVSKDKKDNMPVATQWLLDAAGETGRSAIKSVYLIECKPKMTKGTGFLLRGGYIISAAHVINACPINDLIAYSPFGEQIRFKQAQADIERDLAILTPTIPLKGGLLLGDDASPSVGTVVSTWGFPLGYNGPAPLLSVGYLSGFSAQPRPPKKGETGIPLVKHLVVNGAFNPGNSGGPLFKANDDRVIGLVVSKHVPMSAFQLSALQALATNSSGVTFTATDQNGQQIVLVESQLVADLLNSYKNLAQVMIGEAVSISELRSFLNEQGIKESKPDGQLPSSTQKKKKN